jgi:hypothetical protein
MVMSHLHTPALLLREKMSPSPLDGGLDEL